MTKSKVGEKVSIKILSLKGTRLYKTLEIPLILRIRESIYMVVWHFQGDFGCLRWRTKWKCGNFGEKVSIKILSLKGTTLRWNLGCIKH